jgi:pilus assembly protein FimV
MACAVGFGGINVTSSLGQPLVAEIELVSVEKADKSSLNAHLASPDAFKGAGIDYPYSLPKIKFQVATRANGELYIKATSDQAVNEPFVSLLLELTWSSGRLLREYTFLLDPPGFVAEQPPAVAVKPIEPVVASAVVAAEPIAAATPVAVAEPTPQAASSALAAESAATEAASAVAAEITKPAETKVEPLAKEEPVAETKKQGANSPITVKHGDTLSKIANKTKSSDVSLERMLVALYRANAEAFDGHNMNRLRTGKILRLPESDDLAKVQQAEAVNEVHAQVADWDAYRQKLATANVPAVEQKAKQEATGKISTSIADKAPAAKESPKEVLKLSKGEAVGDMAAAGGKSKSAQEKAIAKEEDSIAKAKALKEAEQRTALLEKNVKDMQRLVELKNQAAAQKGAASAPASAIPLMASSVAAASSAMATSAVAEAKPKPKVVAPKVVAPPPSILDEVLENPLYMGAGAAVLLGLAGLGVSLARRGKKNEKIKPVSHEDVGSASGRITAPVQASPDTGDFTHVPAPSVLSAVDSDDVDPIGEADLFLNFGRDVQAEEVLKEALIKDPSNNAIKLKLLSIYADRKDTKSFYVYALEIKDSNDAAAWAKAAAMGRELEPGNALYGGGTDSAPVASAPVEDTALPAVDFDLGFGTAEPALDVQTVKELDIPASEKTSIMSLDELRAAQEAPMDFDVTGTHPGTKASPVEEPKLDMPEIDFELSGVHPAFKTAAPAETELDQPAMDFDVTSAKAAAPVEQAASLNLDDLVFDALPSATPVVEEEKGLEFSIDLPTETKPAAVAPVKDIGLSEISLDLGDTAAAETSPATETKDEHWQEVATKLDLAKAYQEMGDQAGAREILEEVVRDGDATQRETAETLLQQMS